jgi:glycosyltransferase 2 family protein
VEHQNIEQQHDQTEKEIFNSFKISRIMLPIFLGLGVVSYFLYQKFNPEDFAKIHWSSHTLFWIFIAILLLVARHLFYALRLFILADGSFTYRKCIELIFIWEFSTAAAPTSAGGAAVALFVLSLERISSGRVAVIVIYKVLLDSIFQFLLFPLLFLILGWNLLGPEVHGIDTLYKDGAAWIFITVYGLMIIQGSLLIFGLFFYPEGVQKLLNVVTKLPLLKKFRDRATKFSEDLIIASTVLKEKPFKFHLKAIGATSAAWITRFLLVNCLIVGIAESVPTDFWTQANVFGRIATNYIAMLFMPTPGGSGFAETGLANAIKDYVPITVGYVVALIWRLLTYYPYLIIGAIIVPNWIRRLIEARRKRRLAGEEEELD